MSYDLNFWKYKKNIYLNHQEVYEKCSDEEIVEGLEELPLNLIIEAIKIEFEDWKINESNNFDIENPNGDGSFQIFTTSQFVRFDCYRMNGDNMNRIIEIMDKYDCPLYDSQVSERYDKNFLNN